MYKGLNGLLSTDFIDHIGVRISRRDAMPGILSFPRGRFPGDPDDWTPDTRLTVGHVSRFEQGMQHSDYHGVQGFPLHPFSSDQTLHPLHLSGLQMMGARTVPWAPGRTHLGRLEKELYMVACCFAEE